MLKYILDTVCLDVQSVRAGRMV